MKRIIRVSVDHNICGLYLNISEYSVFRKAVQPVLDGVLKRVVAPAMYGKLSPISFAYEGRTEEILSKLEYNIVNKLAFYNDNGSVRLFSFLIDINEALKINPNLLQECDEQGIVLPIDGWYKDSETELQLFYESGVLKKTKIPGAERHLRTAVGGRNLRGITLSQLEFDRKRFADIPTSKRPAVLDGLGEPGFISVPGLNFVIGRS